MRRLAHRLRRPMRRLLSLLLTPLRGAPADALSDPSTIRQLGFAIESRLIRGGGHPQWLRDVMTRDTGAVFDDLDPTGLSAVEISGDNWRRLPWRQYGQLWFPAFDLCAPGEPPGPYDVVICEQVLEHVPDPVAAVRTLRSLCTTSGYVFVSTPFLVRLHDFPADYWRFTPAGLERLLRSAGLTPLWVRSWGNRQAVGANFDRWVARFPWQSLENEPDLPAVVWSLSQPTR